MGKTPLPARFWIFAAFVLLYGICETMNGNWASLYMTQRPRCEHNRGLPRPDGFLGHCNRRAHSLCRHRTMVSREPHLSGFALRGRGCLVVVAFIPKGDLVPRYSGVWIGRTWLLGAAAVDHQLWSERTDRIAASVAGGLIAFYQIGYGIAAFGVGPLQALNASVWV